MEYRMLDVLSLSVFGYGLFIVVEKSSLIEGIVILAGIALAVRFLTKEHPSTTV
jgi:hypothetical protein